MTLGEIIKSYRHEHGMSMDEFAKNCKLSKAYISILERDYNPASGKSPIPSLETIKAVSGVIGVDFNTVIALLDSSQEVSLDTASTPKKPIPQGFLPLPKMVQKPLIGDIACGEPITAEQNITDYVDVPEDVRCDFCLRCKGDSMIDAGIQDGDLVYIRIQPEVEDGEIAAVRIGNEATLKCVYWDEVQQVLTLVPANRAYRPRTYSGPELEDIQIEGLATGFTHWF